MVTTWRGQSAIIEITETTVGMLQDVEVSAPNQEVQEAYGSGSTEMQDRQKTETAATVTGTVIEWDEDTLEELWDWDSDADQLDDSPDVATFDITAEVDGADGSELEIDVNDAHVDGDVPMGGSREDFLGLDLAFRAPTINDIRETSA